MYRSVTEFDIVRVAPHVDLVLFDNVISCYPCDKDITANYSLGQDVTPSSWDWIGIFRMDWRYLGEYMSYRWAQARGLDCTAPRRRAVVFPKSLHQIPANDKDLYQFLYVSHGNHVVGVSAPFKITDVEELSDFYIAALYKEPSSAPEKQRARKACVPPVYDTFEIINDLPCPSPPKRRAKTKEKVIAVYHDVSTLANKGNFDWLQKFKFIGTHPVVQEYNQSSNLPHNDTKQLKVFDIKWARRQTPSASCSDKLPIAIEYPVFQMLKTGPEAFLLSLQGTGNDCSSCQVAKTLVQDLVERDFLQEERMRYMKLKMNAMLELKSKLEENDRVRCVGLLDLALSQVQDDNKSLRKRVENLEGLLFEARSRLRERSQTGSIVTKVSDDRYGTWIVKDPKRIARIKKIVGRQSRTIHLLHMCNETKQVQISGLQEENKRLRKLVQNAFNTSDKFRELSEELNRRIKSVLAERAKDHTNEWRQFLRNVHETTTQTPTEQKEDRGTSPENVSPSSTSCSKAGSSSELRTPERHQLRNKQISKVLRTEKQQRSKLHKERYQAEQCPTCGLKFSKKTDRRVIEEHIVFHDKMKC
ncbi:calcium-binding and coiled-coil domain-containing protein 2-like [Mercenaria mercenaria]|uniref:calcium-binding and coiled-coil domain-containing protein 2-like n=1 Tax=Mercenaria mercenaria TaxID=6596 RepID=UPI00234EF7A6|nr:calcium-binding and coiled-coil domain-containing protein 2-like [Mercenaria mercenaria]